VDAGSRASPATLSFLGNRLPDREARVEQFFSSRRRSSPSSRFLIGGNGWGDKPMPPNVTKIGHVGTGEHNAFNGSPLAVLNVARDSMAEVGFSPATRVFEAAGGAACLITDAWEGHRAVPEARRGGAGRPRRQGRRRARAGADA
jgi:spore maturation protein CgeB